MSSGLRPSFLPLKDNRHQAFLALNVAPGARRRGVGTALLREAQRRAVAAGRLMMCGNSDRLLAVPSREYDVLTWWDGVPEMWLEPRAALTARMSTDAPMGDLDIEPEVWDAARVVEVCAVAAAQNRRVVESVAVHRATRHLVAYTIIQVPIERPMLAFQWDTLVHAEHRGHRLGQLVKTANLRSLRTQMPAVARIVSWNAEDNEPMLRVNRALGFAPHSHHIEWQRALA